MAAGKRTRFFLAFAAITAAIGLLVWQSFSGSMVYYVTVSEFRSGVERPPGPIRVNGRVVPGSIEHETGQIGVRFAMTDEVSEPHPALQVVFSREVPDTFTDRAEVVVEGKMGTDGLFHADLLLAKCPSKYEASEPEEHSEI